MTLTWDGTGDVDLHTFEPGGAHVYYAALVGQTGMLDVDNTVSYGPEHYFASCDPAILQTGTYRVGINDYARAAGRIATVQVASFQDGVLLTTSLDVGPVQGSSGNASPIPVFDVVVSKDVEGNFSVSAILKGPPPRTAPAASGLERHTAKAQATITEAHARHRAARARIVTSAPRQRPRRGRES